MAPVVRVTLVAAGLGVRERAAGARVKVAAHHLLAINSAHAVPHAEANRLSPVLARRRVVLVGDQAARLVGVGELVTLEDPFHATVVFEGEVFSRRDTTVRGAPAAPDVARALHPAAIRQRYVAAVGREESAPAAELERVELVARIVGVRRGRLSDVAIRIAHVPVGGAPKLGEARDARVGGLVDVTDARARVLAHARIAGARTRMVGRAPEGTHSTPARVERPPCGRGRRFVPSGGGRRFGRFPSSRGFAVASAVAVAVAVAIAAVVTIAIAVALDRE